MMLAVEVGWAVWDGGEGVWFVVLVVFWWCWLGVLLGVWELLLGTGLGDIGTFWHVFGGFIAGEFGLLCFDFCSFALPGELAIWLVVSFSMLTGLILVFI